MGAVTPGTHRFVVVGEPVQQGSMSAVVRGGHAVLIPTNKKKLMPWRSRVAATAEISGVTYMDDDALAADVTFVFSRPQNHYRTNGELKDWAPTWRTSAPDIDKLLRAILDGLTGIAYKDDRQVVKLTGRKRYVQRGEAPRAIVALTLATEED